MTGRYSSKAGIRKTSVYFLIFLCFAVFLSCFPRQSLISPDIPVTCDSLAASGDSSTSKADSYPDRIQESLGKEFRASIPLRLPAPHLWFPCILYMAAGLWSILHRHFGRQNPANRIGNYIIRYIHDQNGETYRPILF